MPERPLTEPADKPAEAAEQPSPPLDTPPPAADRPWRRAAISAAVAWAASHVAYLLVTLMTWRAGHMLPPANTTILSTWLRWDTGHYLRIADRGYGTDELDNAFFPLYPLLIRGANAILPGPSLNAALVVSSLAGFGALLVLHRLVSHELTGSDAGRTVFYLVAFPTGFFLAAAYNASLFLLLAAGALYLMRRGNWLAAGLVAGLASATRSSGLLLALPFVYEYLRQREFQLRRVRPDALALALVPSGLVAFAVYCGIALGDPLAFSHAQDFWYRHFDWPWVAGWHTIEMLPRYELLNELTLINATDLLAALGFLALMTLTVVGPWRFRRDQWYLVIYGFAAVLFPMFNPAGGDRPLLSLARHVLECLPAFILLARIGASRTFERLYLLPAIALQAVLLAAFLHYNWVG